MQGQAGGCTHDPHQAGGGVARHVHLDLRARGIDRAGAHQVFCEAAVAVDRLEDDVGAEVEAAAHEGDALLGVGRRLRAVARGAAVGARRDGGEADAEGRAGAAHGADPDGPGGHAHGHGQVQPGVGVVDVLAVVAAQVVHGLCAQQHAGRAFGEAAARQHQGGAGVAAPADAHVAQGGHDLQQQAGRVTRQAHAPGGGVARHGGGEGLVDQVHGRGHGHFAQVAAVVQGGEDELVGALQAAARHADALPDVGRRQAGLRGQAAGGRGADGREVAGPRGEAFQAQRVAAEVASVVARVGRVGVVAGVAVAAHAQVVGAAGRHAPALECVRASRVEVARLEHGRARSIEDAHVSVQAVPEGRVAHHERQLIATRQVELEQVHVFRAGAGQVAVDVDALVGAQPRVERGAQGVAHVRWRQAGQRCDGGGAAQAAGPAGGGHGDHAGCHAARHGQGEELLVRGARCAVHEGAHVEGAHAAAVDADGQVVGGQPAAFEHEGVARAHRAAHRPQGRHDLQQHARATAQHADQPRARQGRHREAQALAVATGAAGAREGAQHARVVHAQELHQGGVGEALAHQGDGLARHGRGHAGTRRHARAGHRADAGEHARGLVAEVGA